MVQLLSCVRLALYGKLTEQSVTPINPCGNGTSICFGVSSNSCFQT